MMKSGIFSAVVFFVLGVSSVQAAWDGTLRNGTYTGFETLNEILKGRVMDLVDSNCIAKEILSSSSHQRYIALGLKLSALEVYENVQSPRGGLCVGVQTLYNGAADQVLQKGKSFCCDLKSLSDLKTAN